MLATGVISASLDALRFEMINHEMAVQTAQNEYGLIRLVDMQVIDQHRFGESAPWDDLMEFVIICVIQVQKLVVVLFGHDQEPPFTLLKLMLLDVQNLFFAKIAQFSPRQKTGNTSFEPEAFDDEIFSSVDDEDLELSVDAVYLDLEIRWHLLEEIDCILRLLLAVDVI